MILAVTFVCSPESQGENFDYIFSCSALFGFLSTLLARLSQLIYWSEHCELHLPTQQV